MSGKTQLLEAVQSPAVRVGCQLRNQERRAAAPRAPAGERGAAGAGGRPGGRGPGAPAPLVNGGVEVFAVEDTTAQVTWRDLPAGSVLSAGGSSAVV